MGLEQAIIHGKEHREPYKGSKAIDKSCRNHGNHGHGPGNECPWCKGNRMHNSNIKDEQSRYLMLEYEKNAMTDNMITD